MSKKLCLCGCETPLTGKQRKFSSDACRKRYDRQQSGQDTVRELPEIAENCVPDGKTWDLEGFADVDLSALRLELVEVLSGAIGYQEVWVKRCLAQPGVVAVKPLKKMEMHRAAAHVLTQVRDMIIYSPQLNERMKDVS